MPGPPAATRALADRLLRHRHVSLPTKLLRYSLGSAVAFGVSEIVFVVLFAPHVLGAKGSSIVASVAGVVPGYFLNRNWTWGRRGRSSLWRETVPYWLVFAVSTLSAAVTIGAVNGAVADHSRGVRTVINAFAFFGVNGVIFVVKFVLFNRWLFAHREAARTPPGELSSARR